MINARELAFRVLYEVFCNDAFSNLALKSAFAREQNLSREDKNLVTSLVYGVVSRHYTLEYVIKKYSSVKPKKIADNIRIILEMGIYQLMFADRIPQSAAVNESVKLAKKHGRRGSDRFVNAILRTFCRDGCSIAYPEDDTQYLMIKYSYPKKLVRLWTEDFGRERAEEIMRSLNESAPLMLRANTLKLKPDELVKRFKDFGIKTEIADGSLLIAQGFDIARNKLYREGFFSVQDRGAYHAAITLDPKPGETVIDMCAAPGGKTTHIAELMENSGRVISCDIYEHKIKLINDSAKRLGIKTVEAMLSDASVLRESFLGLADRVLCDVPCSGWGIIRRKPDIKLSEIEPEALGELQLSILKNAAEYVKSGGVIVYSTCTINKRENECVTDAFVKDNKRFKKVYEKTFMPDTDGTDGFYICKLAED